MFDHGMSFELGEDVEALRDAVRRFARERTVPLAEETDRENRLPSRLL